MAIPAARHLACGIWPTSLRGIADKLSGSLGSQERDHVTGKIVSTGGPCILRQSVTCGYSICFRSITVHCQSLGGYEHWEFARSFSISMV